DPVSFDRTPVSDGDLVEIGGMRVRVLATPGHTYSHLAYVVEAGGDMAGVFTGGAVAYRANRRRAPAGPAPPRGAHPAQQATASPARSPARRGSSQRRVLAASVRPGSRGRRSRPPSARGSWSTRRSRWTTGPTWNRCWPGWTPGPPTTPPWLRPPSPGPPTST